MNEFYMDYILRNNAFQQTKNVDHPFFQVKPLFSKSIDSSSLINLVLLRQPLNIFVRQLAAFHQLQALKSVGYMA